MVNNFLSISLVQRNLTEGIGQRTSGRSNPTKNIIIPEIYLMAGDFIP